MINASSMQEKRRSPRQQTSISYRLAGLFSARQPVVNISRGGCTIYSEKAIPVGQVIKIQFFWPQNYTVNATVKVMWCQESRGNSLANYRAGLQFTTVSPESIDCLLGLPATPISTPQLQLNKLLKNYPAKTSNTCST
ncbi:MULTISPECIES: PilZ domain-containing protein [Moorena]|nr:MULTISPECIES: PilZ domain-containing protein [Moorena]NEQ15894.1 PilZ domain-containing protein [Moorena sp. SIO3E2]NET64810.1 PilZ domain-containing protein [Moorena sp. SIO1G6]NEP30437.1 PilZ domain-containing protein [Moorena sp. SIO3B2]NEP65332.1 PilZ domain-containing protein [Moorena sp. SIO3A5]NEQ08748.1 PilZ domain-containing protein [Moorena sp. SIO4E2]